MDLRLGTGLVLALSAVGGGSFGWVATRTVFTTTRLQEPSDLRPARLSGDISQWAPTFKTSKLSHGITLRSAIKVSSTLYDEDNGRYVRLVSINLLFLYGYGVLGELHTLKEVEPSSADSIEFRRIGVEPSVIDPGLELVGQVLYRITIRPMPNKTWDGVNDRSDVEVSVEVL